MVIWMVCHHSTEINISMIPESVAILPHLSLNRNTTISTAMIYDYPPALDCYHALYIPHLLQPVPDRVPSFHVLRSRRGAF